MAMVGRAGRLMLALWVLTAPPAFAQSTEGPIVSGIVGAAVLDDEASMSLTVSTGYRFNSTMGLGIELTFVPTIEPDLPFGIAPDPYGVTSIRFSGPGGRATIFTTNLRLEIPTTSRRIVPFAVAGGGVANLKESYEITYAYLSPILFPDLAALGLIAPFPRTYPISRSSVAMALTLGGGVSVLAGEHLSIDVDLRYLGLLGETDRNIGRFGAGASYRF